jgi:hypothetical protein
MTGLAELSELKPELDVAPRLPVITLPDPQLCAPPPPPRPQVAVDHEARAVVVAVRGTLSLEDCITDVLCEPVGLQGWLPDYLAQVMGAGGDAPLRRGSYMVCIMLSPARAALLPRHHTLTAP